MQITEMQETEENAFQAAMTRICDGSPEAIWDFIEEYGPHIQHVIRRRLGHALRAKFDSVDFVQMVWASFFAQPKRIAEFKDPKQLARYLAGMASNKVREEVRRRTQYKRYNVRNECQLRDDDEGSSDNTSVKRPDTPSQIAIARERLSDLMSHRSERDQQIIRLRIQGSTYQEIGDELGIDEKTARQVIRDVAGMTA